MPRVLMATLPSCPTSPRWGALERKRRLWWGDERRNRAVAAVARAVASGDSGTLLGLGLRLTPGEREAGRRAVAVLVEAAQHARALHDELPLGWLLLTGLEEGGESEEGEGPDGAEELVEGRPPRRAVVSLARAWSAGGLRTGVLVRATGGRCPVAPGAPADGVGVPAGAAPVLDLLANSGRGRRQDPHRT